MILLRESNAGKTTEQALGPNRSQLANSISSVKTSKLALEGTVYLDRLNSFKSPTAQGIR